MIKIITLIVVGVIVMYMQNRKYNEDKNRIKELEDKLNQYYIERGKRLNTNIKRIESKHNKIRNNGVHSL